MEKPILPRLPTKASIPFAYARQLPDILLYCVKELGDGMAKQDFPGLVLVPPSDRQIARRRLVRWTVLIVAVIGGISTLNIWLPSPNQTTNCQPGSDLPVYPNSREGCGQQDQPLTEAKSLPSDVTAVKTSQKTSQAEPSSPMPTPAPAASRPVAPHTAKQASLANPQKSVPPPTVRTAAVPRAEQPATSRTAEKPASTPNPSPSSNPNPDTHLAEQGDAFAQYRLGRFYADRSGPEAPEAVSWYMKASNGLRHLADTGNGEAMYVLGVMYAFGRGVQKDTEEARRWLTQAIEHQIPAARPVLASLEKHRIAQSNRTDQGG